jgi:nicotinamidase-related amidase
VQGSEGAAFVEGLQVEKIDGHILKGQDRLIESYSAFKDPWGLCPSTLNDTLREGGIKTLFVVGLGIVPEYERGLIEAEDYCVKSSAIDGAKAGYRTFVVGDCTKGVTPETTETARNELNEAGVEYMDAAEVKKALGCH